MDTNISQNNNRKNIIIIVLSIIIIILVILLITQFIYNNKDSNSDSKNSESITETNKNNDSENENLEKNNYIIKYEKQEYNTKKNNVIITNNSRNIIEITNKKNPTAASKILNSINFYSDASWNNIVLSADDITSSEMDFSELPQPTGLGATLKITDNQYSNNVITFNLLVEGSFGGVGWGETTSYNYDIETGELLTLNSISKDSESFNKKINELVKQELIVIKREGTDLFDDYESEVPNQINTQGNWRFTSEGIEIIFQKYSIAPGATGSIIVQLNKNLINEYLLDKYKFN